MIYARALGDTLRHALEADPRVVMLGEDILDPYGGAFKVTRGLSTDFPTRVRTTPISEAAIAGVSAGLALSGFRPIAEIMFGDFLALCFDQIANHISKYGAMYDGAATCPVVIRAPSGGGRGYGPTHSQSLEKHFLGIPHLRVVAGSLWHDPVALFDGFLADDLPVLHIEHKLLYPLHLATNGEARLATIGRDGSDGFPPTVSIRMVAPEDCSLTRRGIRVPGGARRGACSNASRSRRSSSRNCSSRRSSSPVDWAPMERSVSVTGRLLTVEESTGGWSWGTEIAAGLGSRLFGRLRRAPSVLASARDVIPSAPDREAETLVGERQIEDAVREAAGMKPVMVPTTDVNSDTAIVTAWRVPDRSPVEPESSWPRSRRARRCWTSCPRSAGYLLRGAEEGEQVSLVEPLAQLFPTSAALEAHAARRRRRPCTPRRRHPSGVRATAPATRRAAELGVDLALLGSRRAGHGEDGRGRGGQRSDRASAGAPLAARRVRAASSESR